MNPATAIRDLVEQTPFIDTHEHLIEEGQRLSGALEPGLFPCNDWAFLFSHYLDDDLVSAGMPEADQERFLSPEVGPDQKYHLVAPWWERTRHTGYAQAVRHTLKGLYGEDDLTHDSYARIAEKYCETVRPGFYRRIMRLARVEHCQVNSLQRIFMRTEQPDLLRQDLSIVQLSTGLDFQQVREESGHTARELEGWLEVIDWYFTRYGPLAVAVKNQSAYQRRLDYAPATREEAAPLFRRKAAGETLAPGEEKTLQDFLLRYCVGKAVEQGLPVKLHTGYLAGRRRMPLERVRRNAGDLCPLLRDFPDARFVLMHIGYPYQDEYIALAKHYPNVTIDMCWAWLINPLAGVRFVREFLMAAPATKLLTFGGDYIPAEPVYGHSRLARLGLAQALTSLVEEGWLSLDQAPALVERLMRGNAREMFPAPLNAE